MTIKKNYHAMLVIHDLPKMSEHNFKRIMTWLKAIAKLKYKEREQFDKQSIFRLMK